MMLSSPEIFDEKHEKYLYGCPELSYISTELQKLTHEGVPYPNI